MGIRQGCAAAELGPLPLLLWDRDESLSCSSTPFSSQHLNLEFLGCCSSELLQSHQTRLPSAASAAMLHDSHEAENMQAPRWASDRSTSADLDDPYRRSSEIRGCYLN